jgi:hypothetical protein
VESTGDHVGSLLMLYHLGELSEAEAAPMLVHLEECAACRTAQAQMCEVLGLLAMLATEPGMVAELGMVTGPGMVTDFGMVAEPGVVAEFGMVTEPGVVAEFGMVTEPGVAVEPGVVAETGPEFAPATRIRRRRRPTAAGRACRVSRSPRR